MALTYESYCEFMEHRGLEPMTLKQWDKDEDERVVKPPKKKVKPTLIEEFGDASDD